jgi:hypothetical protein
VSELTKQLDGELRLWWSNQMGIKNPVRPHADRLSLVSPLARTVT